MKTSKPIRLNKLLAERGIASRRKADELIETGRVSIDGKTVRELGLQIDPKGVEIAVDGIPIDQGKPKLRYFVLNKPKQVVTTLSDPEGRETLRDFLPDDIRLFPVGRLDYDTEGVLIVTNDGNLAHRLMHPRFEIPRTYMVKVKGKPSAETIQKLRRGVKLEDGFIKPEQVVFREGTKKHSWYEMVVKEGRNRLIKRIWLRLDHPVLKLVRTNYAGITVEEVPSGSLRSLTQEEIKHLKKLIQPGTTKKAKDLTSGGSKKRMVRRSKPEKTYPPRKRAKKVGTRKKAAPRRAAKKSPSKRRSKD